MSLILALALTFLRLTENAVASGPALAPTPSSNGWEQAFRLHRLDEGRGALVTSLGILFPNSVFDDRELEVQILVGGRKIRPQMTVLARHHDDSVRLARFSLELRPRCGSSLGLRVRLVARKESAASAFSVIPEDGGLRIGNGLVNLLVPNDVGTAFRDLRLERAVHAAVARLVGGEARGESELRVEEDGAFRLVVHQYGRLAAAKEGADLRLDRRLTLWRASNQVIVETWLEADGPMLPGEGFSQILELGFEPNRLLAGNETLAPDSLRSSLDFDRFGRSTRPDLALAIAAEGLVLQGAGQALRVEVEDLVERGPGRLQLDEGRLETPLVSASYRWRPGRCASRRMVLNLARGGRARPDRSARVVVDRGGSEGPRAALAMPRETHADLESRMAVALLPERRRETGFDWRGELNWGDWRWSKMDAGNLEYDSILGLRLAARNLGRPELLWRSRAALAHLLRVDLTESGIPFRHGPGHVGGIEAGHMWLEGVILEALSDADPFLMARLDRCVEAWRGGLKRMRPERELCRSLSWSLILAAALERELGIDDLALDLAPLYRAIGEAPGGSVPLFDRLPAEEGQEPRYLVAPWVTIGLLGEALHESVEAPGLAGARARWRAAVRTLAPQVWNEEAGWPVARLGYDEDGRLLFAEGRMEGEEALFMALGLARLPDADAAESLLRERAFGHARAQLRLESKTLNGIQLSQLMWLMPRFVSGG